MTEEELAAERVRRVADMLKDEINTCVELNLHVQVNFIHAVMEYEPNDSRPARIKDVQVYVSKLL